MRRSILFLVIGILFSVYFLPGCKKEEKTVTHVPFLTGKTWKGDTITVNPPLTYSQLSSADQQSLRNANAWFKIATLRLNEDGTVTQTDYDFGYKKWHLINNNLDIEMTLNNGSKQVLRSWVADANRFYYKYAIDPGNGTSLDCTLYLK